MATPGNFVFVDGSRYEGGFVEVDGKRIRQGVGTLTDGPETYTGGWENDLMSGDGKYSFASGAIYSGSFLQGKFDGEGSYKWPDGSSYTGGWRENKMHGQGKYVDVEGVVWAGVFHNGLFFNGKSYITLR